MLHIFVQRSEVQLILPDSSHLAPEYNSNRSLSQVHCTVSEAIRKKKQISWLLNEVIVWYLHKL